MPGRARFRCALLGSLLLGCGGSTADDAGPPNDEDRTALASACAALAAAMCERRSECHAPSLTSTRYASEASCRERNQLACLHWAALEDTSVSSNSVASCAEEVAGADCREIVTLFYTSSRLPWCLAAGGRSDGEPCASDAQCRSRWCATSDGCGTCRTQYPQSHLDGGYEGDACSDDGDCMSALVCDASACARAPCPVSGCQDSASPCGLPIGGFSDRPFCALGTECKNQNDMGRGTCLAYAADGAACESWAGPPCLFPAVCADGSCRLPTELECR